MNKTKLYYDYKLRVERKVCVCVYLCLYVHVHNACEYIYEVTQSRI